MSQQRAIYLDLEETIINNWYDGLILGSNVNRICNTIKERLQPFDSMHIWSFAIYNEEEVKEFNWRLRPELEIVMRCKFDTIFSVDSIRELVKEYENINYDSRAEFMQLNNKFYSFIKYCQLYKNFHMVLFDDCVPNMIMQIPDKNLTIETIKI